jgi:hypothetical protein
MMNDIQASFQDTLQRECRALRQDRDRLLAACKEGLAGLEHTVQKQGDMIDGYQQNAVNALRAAIGDRG